MTELFWSYASAASIGISPNDKSVSYITIYSFYYGISRVKYAQLLYNMIQNSSNIINSNMCFNCNIK